MTDLAALAKALVDRWYENTPVEITGNDLRRLDAAIVAANAAEIERLTKALEECAAPIPGYVGRSVDDCYDALLIEFSRRVGIARRAQAQPSPVEEKPNE
jgi:hypothetical protein